MISYNLLRKPLRGLMLYGIPLPDLNYGIFYIISCAVPQPLYIR